MILALAFYPVPMFAVFDIIENQITLPKSMEKVMDGDHHYFDIPWLNPNLLFRFFVVKCFIVIGVAVPHFSLLMSFIGSTTGMTLVLIYPCLFNLKLNWNKITNTSIIINTSVVVFGFVAAVLGISSATRAFYTVYNEKY